jgi:hypothetical protein
MNWYLPEKASLSVLYTVKISYLLDRKCEFASRPQGFTSKTTTAPIGAALTPAPYVGLFRVFCSHA